MVYHRMSHEMRSLLAQSVLIIVLACGAMGKISFEKDLSVDAVFPGPVTRPDPSIPEGHMRPLGWQRLTDGPVEEVEGAVSTIEFYNDYVTRDSPLVMRKALPESAPVFDTWRDDDYLVKQYGKVNVSVRVKTGKRHGKVMSATQIMPMKKFLSDYKYEELYLSSVMPAVMMDELPLPSCVKCGTISERLWSAQLWMSSGGTSSRVHSHDDHLLHCVLFGRRDFILIESYHKKSFDFVPDYSGSVGGHSDINTEMIDMFKYPHVARVPWTWSTLKSGDCIFVPAGYVHQVRSYGRSVSITIEFSPIKFFDDTGCTLDDEEFAPLSDASFQWALDAGELRLTNRNLNADDIRNMMAALMGKESGLSFYRFDHFYSTLKEKSPKAPSSRSIFDMLMPSKGQGFLMETDLLGLPARALSRVAEVFNSLHRKEKRARDEF